jgi:hypothetical protein
MLLEKCRASQKHTISGRTMTIAAAMEQERPHLLPMAAEGFALEDVLYPVVDGKGCVRVKTNWYSTPLDAGVRPMVKVWPTAVEIFRDFECVARHPRCYGRGHQLLSLEHYLDVLERKPGAMAGSTPLEQWRAAGRWPVATGDRREDTGGNRQTAEPGEHRGSHGSIGFGSGLVGPLLCVVGSAPGL